MLSRIADSMFWLNRYMERCDGLLRGVRTQYILLLDKGVNAHLSWQPILEIFSYAKPEEITLMKDNADAALHHLLLDANNLNSLKLMITKSRENARGVQDHITKEVWEHINQMYHLINTLSGSNELQGMSTIATFDALTNNCILYNGVADTTMPRGLSWSFMSLGKYVERCLITLEMTNKYFAMIGYNVEDEKDILQWRPLLLSLSGFELHLKTYRTNSYNQNALHQVLFNENFTRSVLYTLKRIEKYFQDVTKNNDTSEIEALSKHLGRLISKIQYTDFQYLNHTTLQPFLVDTRKELVEFSTKLGQHFFSYS